MSFLDQPLSHWAARTSRDVCRDACAIQTFKRRMPAHEKALYIVSAVAVAVVAMAVIFN